MLVTKESPLPYGFYQAKLKYIQERYGAWGHFWLWKFYLLDRKTYITGTTPVPEKQNKGAKWVDIFGSHKTLLKTFLADVLKKDKIITVEAATNSHTGYSVVHEIFRN